MAIPLKYATASQEVPIGPFLDAADGDSAETGLTIANTDILLWKSGATSMTAKNSGGATHMSGGVYYCVLDDTDTNTYGPLVIFVHVSGALAVRLECWVMEADAYDALYAASGTGHMDIDVTATLANKIADAVLTRDWTSVTGEASRSVLNALRFLRNKWSISGSTLTVTEEDDATGAWTATLTTDSGADPVTASDPT